MTSTVAFMGSRPLILPCAMTPISISAPSLHVQGAMVLRNVPASNAESNAQATEADEARLIDTLPTNKPQLQGMTSTVPVMGSRPTILRCQPISSAAPSVHASTKDAKASRAVRTSTCERKHVHWTQTVSTRRFDQEGLLEEKQTQLIFRSRQPEAWRRFVIRPVQRLARAVADITCEDPSIPQAPYRDKQASFANLNFAWVTWV